jgi:hypothetical protein
MSVKKLHFKLEANATEGSELLKIAYEGHKMEKNASF